MKKHFSLKHCIAICLAMMLCATTIFAQQTTLKVSGKNVTTTFGQTITLRGINYPIIDDGSISLANAASYQFLIDEAAKTGANTIRLPWWLPGTHWRDGITPGTIAGYMNNGHLSNIIAYCISKKMIPVLELHNYTCSNNWTDFNNSITNFWLSAPVLSAINTNKSAIIINLANEFGYDANWGGNMATFTTNYTNAITAMRNAGVNVPIMIDAPNCGTASSSLVGVANSLLANDPQHNLIFSVHAYWGSYANNQAAITTKINEIDNSGTCFVFGEVANTQDDNGCGDMSLATIYPEVLTQACSKNIGWYAWTYDQDCSSPREMTTDGNFANLTIYGNDIVYNANYGLKSAGGCKAVAYSTTPACTPTTSTTNYNICPSELPFVSLGHTYYAAGTYTYNLINAAGCDSTATVNITLKNVYTITPISAPNGTIDIMNVRNVCYGFSSSLYRLTPNNGYFIDSIILDGIPSKVNFNFRFSYSYSFSNVTSNHTIQGVFKPLCTPTTSITNITTCNTRLPYIWNGLTFNTTGSQTAHLTNAAGCDSAATLNLTVYQATTSTTTITATNNYTWNGTTYNASGTYTYTTSNAVGCDSVATLNLTIQNNAVLAISGANSVCVGSAINLTANQSGGTWSSITGRATVSNVGVVTGTSAGTATIKYTVAGQSVTKIVTVYAIPGVPQFAYAPGTRSPQTTSVGGVIQMCTNKTFTLIGNPANGVWSRAGNFTASPLGTASTNVNVSTAGASGMGSIAYTVTNSNGCSNSRVLSANIVSCGAKGLPSTDDRQPSTVDFVIYPNPAKNVLNLTVTKLIGDGQIILTNMLGKQVATQALSMGNSTIDISNLAKGMYFVSVITNEGKQTKKLVVE